MFHAASSRAEADAYLYKPLCSENRKIHQYCCADRYCPSAGVNTLVSKYFDGNPGGKSKKRESTGDRLENDLRAS